MKKNSHSNRLVRITLVRIGAIVCAGLLVPGDIPLMAQQAASSSPAATPARIPPDQLDSLVAPIALYPDQLLAQVLAASTYPLEVVQLEQWLQQHKDLKDQQLADAVQKENWDPSIQAMAALPDVVKQMADNISWTSELGNAFLAQQSDVMDAVQRMRVKAKDNGKLQSGDQIKVDTENAGSQSVVVIQQADPQVVYIPQYDPAAVWGASPAYAYPAMTYPVGYLAAGAALSFGVGIARGAMWGGGWGWNCGWHGGGNNTININNNNNFNRNYNNFNRTGGNQIGAGGSNTWQHNPQHRGAAPYANGATANRFGGATQGGSFANRQANGRQNIGNSGGIGGNSGGIGNRGGAAGGAAGNRSGQGIGGASRDAGAAGGIGNRGGAGGQGVGGANRGGGGGGGGGGFGGGGGDRIGNRQVSGGFGGSGAFGAGGGSGASARSSMSRGASSFGGGGGGSRGGGGGRRR